MKRATPPIAVGGAEITVVVPAWDDYVGAYLSEAIESLLSQGRPARLLVVDNRSRVPVAPRRGVEVVRSDERLSVGGARNFGLAHVHTPYVMFWDADDVMLPGTLHALARALDAEPEAVAATGTIYESVTAPHHWPRASSRKLAHRRRTFALVHAVSSLFPTTGAVLLRTEAVRDAGGFPDCDCGDDWALGASLAFRGRVRYLEHPGRLYRQHPGSLSAGWRPVPDLVNNANVVRRRLRTDPALPWTTRPFVPLLAVLQMLVIFGLRPLRSRGGPSAGGFERLEELQAAG